MAKIIEIIEISGNSKIICIGKEKEDFGTKIKLVCEKGTVICEDFEVQEGYRCFTDAPDRYVGIRDNIDFETLGKPLEVINVE